MKRNLTFAFLFVIAFTSFFMNGCGYNTMVSQDEAVNTAWSQVENQYQRRADLIPNLVQTVQGAASFEKETFTQVADARSKVSQIKLSAEDLKDPEKFAAFQKAQDGLSSALSKLMMIKEAYPELKANQNFLNLQSQLEGTENRITVERKKFNEVVQTYNTNIRSFPNNIFANIFGFKQRPYFKGKEGTENAPDVKFDFNKK